MAGLKPVSAKKVIRKFKIAGFEETHQRGSHVYLKNESNGRIITVPMHSSKDIPIGTLYNIVVKQAKMSVEEFNNL